MMLTSLDQGATVSLTAQTQTESNYRFLFDFENFDIEMRMETPQNQEVLSIFQKVFLHSPAGTEEVRPYMDNNQEEKFVGHSFYHKESSSKDCEFFSVCPKSFEIGIDREDRTMSHILAQLKKNDKIWLVTFGAPNSETVFMGKLWFANENAITTAGAMFQFDRETTYNVDLEYNSKLNEIKARVIEIRNQGLVKTITVSYREYSRSLIVNFETEPRRSIEIKMAYVNSSENFSIIYKFLREQCLACYLKVQQKKYNEFLFFFYFENSLSSTIVQCIVFSR